MSLFHDAPSLRDLELDFMLTPALVSQILTPSFIPWHQLTKVVSSMNGSATTARNILRLCTGLQICILANIKTLDVSDQPPLCILGHLCTLELTGGGDRPFTGFFESLAFPSLNALVLESFTIPARSLLELHSRSQFQLKELEISWPRLTVSGIMQFLRLLPTLESLILTQCDGTGNLFRAFTYRGDTTASVLALPHLMKLGLGENYDAVRWDSHIDQARRSLEWWSRLFNTLANLIRGSLA
ncbi:hypothetical protein B0H19DRAFT_1273859 [Mycena capillaripes]|nr:hypothetical protein B0H19DRAFT_1273859 [Mycena capillaripes]